MPEKGLWRKSTFMKSFSIALFLAHVGFPVPAEGMEFSVRNGMFTTINLPDNPVSYTHLDVYKRQRKDLSVQIPTGMLVR